MPNVLQALLALLVMAAFIGGLAALLYWAWRRRGRAEADPLYPPADVTRLALASLWLQGPPLRQTILKKTANPFRAFAPEPGLDFPLVLAACKAIDEEERPYWWAIAALALATLVFYVTGQPERGEYPTYIDQPGNPWPFLVCLAGLVAVAVRRQWVVRFRKAPRFTRAEYDAAAVRAQFPGLASPPPDQAPAIVHGVADPFIGLGENLGGWNLAFDVRRPAPGGGPVSADLPAAKMDAVIAEAIRRLAVPSLAIDEALFVNGGQTVAVGLQAAAEQRPPTHAPAPVMDAFRHQADPAARVYRRATITDWSGELVLSYLFRCLRRGDVLAVEAVQLVLTPLADPYRGVDRLRALSSLGLIGWWAGAILRTPLEAVVALQAVARQLGEVIDEMFGGVETRERREIRADPVYNYGALWSLRTHLSARRYASYFQKADAFQYFRAIDEQVLNAVKDCLEARGIDTQSLGQQATTIYNNAIQISGARDVALQGVAMGQGAAAQVARAGGARKAVGGGKA